MCDAASLRVLSSKVAFASPQRLSALRASFNRTVGCLVKCSSPSDSSRRPVMLHSQKITDAADEHKHPFICVC